jgi:hypothetical protein
MSHHIDMPEAIGTVTVTSKVCVDNIIVTQFFIASITPLVGHVCESLRTLTISRERDINVNSSIAGLGRGFLLCVT